MTTTECNQAEIHQLLSDATGSARAGLIEHLDTCEQCRRNFDLQVAPPEDWLETRRMLQPAEFDLASSIEFSAGGQFDKPTDHPSTIQAVLESLAPTDAPHRLGRLGTYEVTGVVGAGGMGVVLKAIDPALDRVVAVKVLAPHLANSDTARKRFAREARAAAAVLHPNIISIHSVSDDQTTPYLVMSYIRGGSLQKRLEQEGPLPTLEILRIGSQLAAGLAAAHEKGLVHRDIKPENMLLEEGVERVTLTDFGLARAVDDASITREGVIAGTPQYMSPEQARGEPVDQLSDLFSLGSVLYALATGLPPFRASSSYGVMRQISDKTPAAVHALNPKIPDWLSAITGKLMAKEKEDRFQSASEVSALMDVCLSHLQQQREVDLHEHVASYCHGVKQPGRRIKYSKKTFLIGGALMAVSITLMVFALAGWMPAGDAAKNTALTPNESALLEALKHASEDTEYSRGYAEKKFQSIAIGDSIKDVEKKIGKPFQTVSAVPLTRWLYAPEKHPRFATNGTYPSVAHAFNVVTFDNNGVFTGAMGQGAGKTTRGNGRNTLIVAELSLDGSHPGPLGITGGVIRELKKKHANTADIRKRFGEPQAKYVSHATRWLKYSRSPSGGNYRRRWLGIDSKGRVCDKRSEYYWD